MEYTGTHWNFILILALRTKFFDGGRGGEGNSIFFFIGVNSPNKKRAVNTGNPENCFFSLMHFQEWGGGS